MPIVKKVKESISKAFEEGKIALLVNNINCTKDPKDEEIYHRIKILSHLNGKLE